MEAVFQWLHLLRVDFPCSPDSSFRRLDHGLPFGLRHFFQLFSDPPGGAVLTTLVLIDLRLGVYQGFWPFGFLLAVCLLIRLNPFLQLPNLILQPDNLRALLRRLLCFQVASRCSDRKSVRVEGQWVELWKLGRYQSRRQKGYWLLEMKIVGGCLIHKSQQF